MPSIYDLTGQFSDLRDIADSTEPEDLAPCFQAAMADTERSIEAKFEAMCMVIADLEAVETARCAEASRLRDRAKHAANSAQRIKGMMKDALVILSPEQKIKAGVFDVAVVKNGGKQPLTINGDVPDLWSKTEITKAPNLDLIRHELSKGGCLPFAILEPRGSHVRIR